MNCKMQRRYRRLLSLLICPLIVMPTAIAGQTSSGVEILIVEGDRAQNLLSEPAPKPISVRIVDRTGRPLPNATVEFVLPEFGPGGEFIPSAVPVTVISNGQGLAVAPILQANSTAGTYQVQIVASYMGQVTRLLLEQTNVTKKKSSKKLIIISAVIGGAAAAAFAAKGGGGNEPSTPPPPARLPTAPPIVFLNSSVGAPQ